MVFGSRKGFYESIRCGFLHDVFHVGVRQSSQNLILHAILDVY